MSCLVEKAASGQSAQTLAEHPALALTCKNELLAGSSAKATNTLPAHTNANQGVCVGFGSFRTNSQSE